jgi:N4-gp56 family major capsid protein
MANNTTINSELFTNLLVQAQYAMYENSIARQLATVFDYPVNSGKVVQIPVWGSLNASKPGEGVAPSAQDTNTTSKTITLEEHVVYAQVTDMLRDSAQEDVITSLANQSGLALAEAIDKELISYFATVSNSIGSAGSDNTAVDIMKAAATIRANKYSGPLFAILNPKQAYGIKAALTATTAYTANTNVGNNILSNQFIGQLAGVQIYESALVVADGSDDATGCVFAKEAFGLAQRGGIAMGTQRQETTRSTDVVMTAVAGAVLIRPEFAVKLIGDALV